MAKEYLNPPSLFNSLGHGFSQAVVASGRRTIYLSGQTAWNAEKSLIGGQDFAEQTMMAFRNVRTAIEFAGGTMADVVSLRLYIVDYTPDKAPSAARCASSFRTMPGRRRHGSAWPAWRTRGS